MINSRSSITTDEPLTLSEGKNRLALGTSVELEVLVHDGNYVGLGEVVVDGALLRRGNRTLLPEIRSPDAIHFDTFHLEKAERLSSGGIRLKCGLSLTEGGPMEWMVHTIRPRYRRVDWNRNRRRADDCSLIIEIEPVTRPVGTATAHGLSYRYAYKSASIPIYKILDRATWEPGGSVLGNEFWLRNSFAPPIFSFKDLATRYSTEWFLPSANNPNVFEFLPFQTQLSGFTMTAHRTGTLLTWVPTTSHVRSLFEKQAGDDHLVHLHELCGDLALEFAPPAIEVLWIAGAHDRVQRINLYESMRAQVSKTLHEQVGLRIERAASYGVMEEWGNPDLRKYADEGLPKLAAAGVGTLFLCNQFENNMNAYGVSNMCCTTDLRVADSVGEENLAYLCRKAADAGIRVEMWGNTALSSLAWMAHVHNGRPDRIRFPDRRTIFDDLSKAADAWVRNPSNAIEADHYAPVFVAMNLRDETVRKVWNERWRDARERLGLGGIFLDSSFNMSSDKFHWIYRPNATGPSGATSDQMHLLGFGRPAQEPQPEILSQYMAHLTLMAEMQEMGYVYCGEDMGVFGLHRASAPSNFLAMSLPIWCDCMPDFDPVDIAKLGYEADDVFFRGVAYRALWKLHWDPALNRLTWIIGQTENPAYAPTEEQFAILRAYTHVRDYLEEREVLPGEKGVVYRSPGKTVIWSFEPFSCKWKTPASVQELTTRENSSDQREFNAVRRGIYLVNASIEELTLG